MSKKGGNIISNPKNVMANLCRFTHIYKFSQKNAMKNSKNWERLRGSKAVSTFSKGKTIISVKPDVPYWWQINRLPTNAGVACPLAFVANIWLNILEPESNLRTIFCGLLIHLRHTIASVYLINLLFSFIFRTFLVIYSDRGLVRVIS